MLEQFSETLNQFRPISLSEMKAVKLMNRVDTKYITTLKHLPEILRLLQSQYFIQEIDDLKIAHYQTLYYDTPDLQMYVAHQDGKLTRQKLRTRIYCDSQIAFCEIKNKNNKKRTKKKRIEIDKNLFNHLSENDIIKDFVRQYLRYDVDSMIPQVQNQFERITLVNESKTERLTIDSNLQFINYVTQQSAELANLVIIELKQDGFAPSYFKRILLEMRIPPYRISKYCIGTLLTNPKAKNNRFKKKIHYINRLLNP